MDKKFRIEIKKFEEYETVGQDYRKTSDTGNPNDGGPVYEYIKFDTTRTRETEVLVMELDELDLKKVVAALILNQ